MQDNLTHPAQAAPICPECGAAALPGYALCAPCLDAAVAKLIEENSQEPEPAAPKPELLDFPNPAAEALFLLAAFGSLAEKDFDELFGRASLRAQAMFVEAAERLSRRR